MSDDRFLVGRTGGASERGPNYNWEHEARHYRDECDKLRELLQKVERSGDLAAHERDQLRARLAGLEKRHANCRCKND